MSTWDERIAAVWADDSLTDDTRIEAIDRLAAERPDDARALFERAGARDSAGIETDAEPLYRRALELGLDDEYRPQAVVQLASTIRNLGRAQESLALLTAEAEEHPDSPYRDELAAFTALVLVSLGEERRAVAVALAALAPHLHHYTRSVTAYAAELVD